MDALGDAEAGGEEQAGERVFPDAAGGKINGEGIESPYPGGDFCGARAERVVGAEVDGDAGEGAEQAVGGENYESRGKRVDAEEAEDHGEQRGIERGLHGCGSGPGPVG